MDHEDLKKSLILLKKLKMPEYQRDFWISLFSIKFNVPIDLLWRTIQIIE